MYTGVAAVLKRSSVKFCAAKKQRHMPPETPRHLRVQ